jgi:hypothetical protein
MSDPFQYLQKENKTYIWDAYRKKYVFLSKEEWVRQNMLYYLVQVKQYPSALISVEKQITVGSLKKRYDAVIYHNDKPWLLLECKEENEKLNDAVLQQLLSYKSVMDVAYIAITNGREAHCYDIQHQTWIQGFPDYPEGV